jgi:hypothetical protein
MREFHAHCVSTIARRATVDECVVGKNYRLQDIQLSKIIRGSAPNPGSVARGAPMPRSAPSQLAALAGTNADCAVAAL